MGKERHRDKDQNKDTKLKAREGNVAFVVGFGGRVEKPKLIRRGGEQTNTEKKDNREETKNTVGLWRGYSVQCTTHKLHFRHKAVWSLEIHFRRGAIFETNHTETKNWREA